LAVSEGAGTTEGVGGTGTNEVDGAPVAGKAKPRPPYRLSEARLDGKLGSWPEEPPKAPKTPLEKARLGLIAHPGEVHRLAWRLSDVGRAGALASSFARAKPAALYPGATGTFEARAYFDPGERKWRVAARYVPGEGDVALQA
jgi:hypothetical protein